MRCGKKKADPIRVSIKGNFFNVLREYPPRVESCKEERVQSWNTHKNQSMMQRRWGTWIIHLYSIYKLKGHFNYSEIKEQSEIQ